MADLSKYMSALYSEGGQIGNEDMRQTVEYQFVKAYPSVNSTNGGSIHSESNVRWLTKQFTKKPFLIPHDGNPEKDMFKMKGSAGGINGVYVDGLPKSELGSLIGDPSLFEDLPIDLLSGTDNGETDYGTTDNPKTGVYDYVIYLIIAMPVAYTLIRLVHRHDKFKHIN